MAELAPGTRLAGYTIVSAIGHGGMGAVYGARDAKGREVALKVVSRALASDESFRARFRREGRAGKAVRHENVVALLDAGEDGETAFLVFELVAGGTLAELIKARGRLEWREAAALGAGIARGLAAIHAQGLVHRDLKPENVLLAGSGEGATPKVSDLGLVGAFSASLAVSQALTRTGELVGTLAYMAPEQADGQRTITASADLYGLGALLHCVLTGTPPFQGTGYSLVKKHLVSPPPSCREAAPDVPEGFERLVLSLLAKKPEERPASASEVALALDAISREGPARKGRRALAVTGALVVLAALAVLLVASGVFSNARAEALEHAERAASLYQERKYDETIDEASRAITLDAALPSAWLLRGRARLQKGAPEAVADLAQAVLLDPNNASARSDLGWARQLSGDGEGAIAELTRALELDPRDAHALHRRGTARGVRGDSKGALADLDASIRIDPQHAQTWKNRGQAHYARNELEAAIADLERSVELDAKDADAWHRLGLARKAVADRAGALAAYTRAIELDPKNAYYYAARGHTRVEPDAAVADFTRAIELDPKLAAGWTGRGCCRQTKGDLDGAIADLSRGIELEPRNAAIWADRGIARQGKDDLAGALDDMTKAVELGLRSASAWSNLGAAKGQANDLDGAIECLTKAIEIDPHYADAYKNRGLCRQMKGDEPGSLADCERFLELAPRHPSAGMMARAVVPLRKKLQDDLTVEIERSPSARALAARGEVLRHQEQLEAAIADFTRALELDPKHVPALFGRGCARMARRDFEGALADLTAAIELDPKDPRTVGRRGRVRAERGDLRGAAADFTRLIELDATDAVAYFSRGTVRLELGEPDAAISDFTRAIELDAGLAYAWHDRGRARARKGDAKGAFADIERSTQLDPSDPDEWKDLAALRSKRGDQDGAIADLTRALELDPQSGAAHASRAPAREAKGDLEGALADYRRALELGVDAETLGTVRAGIERVSARLGR